MKNKLIRKEDGLTITELIAAIAIASIIIIFITSVFVMVQKQYNAQQEDASNLTDVKIALKSITRDIRKADIVDVDNTTFKKISIQIGEEMITYEYSDENALLKNGAKYIYDVTDFYVKKEEDIISLKIVSGDQEEETTIYLRN